MKKNYLESPDVGTFSLLPLELKKIILSENIIEYAYISLQFVLVKSGIKKLDKYALSNIILMKLIKKETEYNFSLSKEKIDEIFAGRFKLERFLLVNYVNIFLAEENFLIMPTRMDVLGTKK